MIRLVFLLVVTIGATVGQAQSDFYATDSIQEIRIYFTEKNWDAILDSLYIRGLEERHLASIKINGQSFDSIGIRYKGFSSASVNRKKNPFNIKLNYIKNQKYEGIDKIKLSNVIQDPSFLREVLSYEIAGTYMPASRANFANVFINDTLWGLYTNVEAVNNEFLPRHFSDDNGVLFKCNPENLDLDGENSNLSNSPGPDSTSYYHLYELRSDSGWSALLSLIHTLNEAPSRIETYLNVDRTLWMHAFNYALINFDSYVGYAQNYYLYKDKTGQFNPIIWDLNMSFASFRLTDASEHFNGFSIEEAKVIDPLLHYNSVSILPRPLMRRLFEIPTYRRMYLAHLRTIISEYFSNGQYYQRGLRLQALIDDAVRLDENKFYSYEDFLRNIDTTVTDLIAYPGIYDLMEARTNFINDYPGLSDHPSIETITYQQIDPGSNAAFWFNCNIKAAESVWIYYRTNRDQVFQKKQMFDDGFRNDGAPNDGLYGVALSPSGNSIEYYVYAENIQAGQFSPVRAAYEYYTLDLSPEPGDLVINELLALNESVSVDEFGEYEDWLELYNNTAGDISLHGLRLSDDATNLDKWALPDTTLGTNQYMIIWCDSEPMQGDLHANFKLSSAGESLILSTETGTILDSVSFGIQNTDEAYGRWPNGTGPFRKLYPTPGSINSVNQAFDEKEELLTIAPNPSNGIFEISNNEAIHGIVRIYNSHGNIVFSTEMNHNDSQAWSVDLGDLPDGPYYLELRDDAHHAHSCVLIKI